MADAQTATIAKVRVERFDWATLYEGKMEDLIDAGIGLKPDMFADGTKRDKRGVSRMWKGVVDGREVQTHWKYARGTYVAYFYKTEEEWERTRQERHKFRIGDRVRVRDLADFEYIVTALPHSVRFYGAEESVQAYGLQLVDWGTGKPHRGSWCAEVEDNLVLASASYSAHASIAAEDAGFQRFLRNAAGHDGERPSS